jgi:hypothetical protein
MDRMGTSGRYEPEWPPEHVWREVDQAARVWDKLQARGRELHFELEDAGRMRIEIRDLDGNLLRSVAPSEALAIASGSWPSA